MDKKRVFNAAVTAGLSLSMVLTSVPATALAQGESVLAKNNLSEAAQYGVWVSNWDTDEVLYSGDNIKWIAGTTLEDIVPGIALNITVPEGKTIQWVGANGQPLDLSTVINGDTFIYVKFVEAEQPATEDSITLVYTDGEGNMSWSRTPAIEDGALVDDVDAPTLDGYEFIGWNTSPDNSGIGYTASAINDATDLVAGQTYYTIWSRVEQPADSIEVTLDMNYPDGSDAQVVATADENGKISAPADPTCEGFDFVGWAVNGNTDNMVTSGVAGDMVYTADTTLVAQWVEAPKATAKITYQVTNPADGSYYEIETTADQAGHVAQPADPSAEGFDFVGWAVNGDTDNVFTSGAISSVAWDEDTTFVALWAPVSEDSVTLTYKVSNPADGSYYEIQATVDEDGHVAKPADPAAEGYEFVGWAVEGTTNIFTSGAIETLTWEKDTTFVAQWAPVADEAPTVTYNVTNPSDGSSYQIVATVDSTGHVSKPADPADEGYVFVGWKMDGTEDVYTSGAISFLTWDEDVSFTAQWVAEPVEEESVEITYDLNFPDGSDAQVVATANEDGFVARPADPTCTGWKFIGWKCINPAGDDLLTSDDVASISWSSDQLLQAQWEKVADPVAETHTVTFDYCLTNTNDLLVEVVDGQPVARPADPTCAGYVFTGWYSDVDRTQLWDFSTPVTSDMTLYANWAEAETPSDPVVPGDDTATPETPQESEEAKAEEAKSEVPETGDATNAVAVTGIGIAGLMAAAASFILRRRNEQ